MPHEAIDYGDAVLFMGAQKIQQLEAWLQAKDKQIAALVRSMEEIKAMTHCDALGDRYTRARQVAIIAIKGATS